MTLRLRAHHLLCMLTWVGKGYTPGFTVNYDRIALRIARGEPIQLVEGPDDICAPLLAEENPHCHRHGVTERDSHAARAIGRLLGRTLSPGDIVMPDARLFALLRTSFADGGIRQACHGCEWSSLCTGVARNGFHDVRILPDECGIVVQPLV